MRTAAFAAAALLALAVPRAAAADTGFAEVIAGIAKPMADDDYEDFVDESFKLGLRFGAFAAGERNRAGIELAVDWTPVNHDLNDGGLADIDMSRFRALAGVRLVAPIGPKGVVFGRAGAGVDYVTYEGTFLGVTIDDDDTGLALEVGGGVLFDLGGFAIGAQLAVPMAFHDSDNSADWDDYSGYDLDLLFTLATSI